MRQAMDGTRRRLVAAAGAAVVVLVVMAGCGSGKAPVVDQPAERPRQGSVPVTEPEEVVEERVEVPDPGTQVAVVVNGVELDGATLDALAVELGWAVAEGAYWYDPVLGAVGYQGGPTAGFLPPGLAIGGPLLEDASAGTTGVVVNGRELPVDDLVALEQLFGAPIPPDRYFLDAEGWYGYEGDVALGNVFDVVAASQQQTGGGGVVEETAGGWVGGEGTDGYYFDPESGCSVMAGDGVSC